MNIRSTRRNQIAAPKPHTSPKPTAGEGESESWSVPRIITKPRSVVSNTIKLLRAADGFGLMKNPVPRNAQDTVSALGVAFYGTNVGAELLDGDYKGAIKDIGNGWLSFTAGAKILGLNPVGASGMYAVGGLLNLTLAADEIKNGDKLTGALRAGNAVGLLMSAANGILGGQGTLGAFVGPASQLVLGTVGLSAVVRDLAENGGFYNRPDMFS